MKLVVLAGQSNMAGRGYAGPDDLAPVPGVKHFARDNSWREAIEPITKDRPFVGTFAADGTKRVSPDPWDAVPPGAGDRVVGVGPGRTFGRLLRAFCPDEEIGLVPVAVGGTPVSAWLPGGVDPHDPANHPYDDAVARIRAAQADGEVCAILWHQGEGDCGRTAPDAYAESLRTVIANFRRDLGLAETVPFVMGTLARFYGDKYPRIAEFAPGIDAAMERVAATTPYAGLVCAHDLSDRGDGLHFDTASQHALGERYFRMWRSMAAVTPEKLAAQAAKYRDAPRVRTRVLLDPGELLVTSPFGPRRHPVTGEEGSFHAGADGALWNGRMLLETGICAWKGGVVAEAADGAGPAGTAVAVDHGGGWTSRYFHLEAGSLHVGPGDRVEEGTLLGWMGRTGRATGEHLHFQLERDGLPVDPLPFLAR